MLGDALLKWYDIAPYDTPVPLAIRALARRCLRDACKAGTLGVEDGLGFVILHRCGGDFYFLLVSTWRNENELWETVWAKRDDERRVLQPVAERRDAPPHVLRVGARCGRARAGCVDTIPLLAARRGGQARLPPRLVRRGRLRDNPRRRARVERHGPTGTGA